MHRRAVISLLGTALLVPGLTVARPGGVRALDLEEALAPRFVGSADAGALLIEYFSLTCPHCARFHTDVWPEIKKKYVDTGRLRLELRDFPLDQWALRAAALARCLPPKQYAAMIDLLMKQQAAWAGSEQVVQALVRLGQLAGISETDAMACMTNRPLLEGIAQSRLDGQTEHDVQSTPSFVLNGERISAVTFEDFDSVLSGIAR